MKIKLWYQFFNKKNQKTKQNKTNKKKIILKPKYIFMIRKNRSFCDQTLDAVAILEKKLKIFKFSFKKFYFLSFNAYFF